MSQEAGPKRLRHLAIVLLASVVAAAAPAQAQLQWKSADEKMVFKIGLLGQMQAESADVANSDDTAKNLFFRRARILMSFTLSDKLSIFFDTDSPNLGKSNAEGVKDAGDMFIQDFVATYKFSDEFQLDGGLILPVTSYNHGQSAASLMPVDYGPYTFIENAPLGARVGRDYGLQARGYLLPEDRLEYRVGLFQGSRGVNATNSFRTSARVMYQFFTPQKGLFYRGTSLGKTKTVALGASFDQQEEYDSLAFDVFADLPLAGGNGLTLQADYMQADGDVFLASLSEQTDLLLELGFYIASSKLMPFVQYAEQDFDDPAKIDQEKLSIGIGYFPSGHNHNLKLSFSQIEPAVGDKLDLINLQWQIFQF
jgi:hypothetical protein